jgi:hypothetical protein
MRASAGARDREGWALRDGRMSQPPRAASWRRSKSIASAQVPWPSYSDESAEGTVIAVCPARPWLSLRLAGRSSLAVQVNSLLGLEWLWWLLWLSGVKTPAATSRTSGWAQGSRVSGKAAEPDPRSHPVNCSSSSRPRRPSRFDYRRRRTGRAEA